MFFSWRSSVFRSKMFNVNELLRTSKQNDPKPLQKVLVTGPWQMWFYPALSFCFHPSNVIFKMFVIQVKSGVHFFFKIRQTWLHSCRECHERRQDYLQYCSFPNLALLIQCFPSKAHCLLWYRVKCILYKFDCDKVLRLCIHPGIILRKLFPKQQWGLV